MSSSSSDSDTGERVKNVRSLLFRNATSTADNHQEADENCAYKRKLGDLIFNANFEAGNLGYVEQIDQYQYDLMIRPDVTNPRHCLWFNFTVSNQRPNQCVIFTLVNLSDNLRLFHEGMTSVVRSRQKPNWLRLHEDQVFYYRSSNHGNRYVLSLAFRFSTFEDEHQFALFYPYDYTQLVNFITRWTVELKRRSKRAHESRTSVSPIANRGRQRSRTPMRRSPDHHQLRSLQRSPVSSSSAAAAGHDDCLRTRSSQGFAGARHGGLSAPLQQQQQFEEEANLTVRSLVTSPLYKSIYLLEIKGTAAAAESQPACVSLPKVVVLCRAASCANLDGPASLVCQGLLDFLLSSHLVACAARQNMDLTAFPMVDPDSICAGNSRTDIMGQSSLSLDFIRANPSTYAHLVSVYEAIEGICSTDENRRIILIEVKIDLSLIGSRIRGTQYEDSLRMERHFSFPRLLARFANDFYLENCEFLKPQVGSSPSWVDFRGLTNCTTSRPNVDQYRLEVSPFASYRRSFTERTYDMYNQQRYLALGKAIVYSLLELLRPKEQQLPHCVAATLDAFRPKAGDIDDLLLLSDHLKGKQNALE